MSQSPNPELIVALVAPLGVDLVCVEKRLSAVLAEFAYSIYPIRLSDFLHSKYKGWEGDAGASLERYIGEHQRAGNDLRQAMRRKDALALVALSEIAEARSKLAPEARRRVFLVRQLKTPEEVQCLRDVYGERLVLIGITAPYEIRRRWLADQIALSNEGSSTNFTRWEEEAKKLIAIDDREAGQEYGQNVSVTFPLADFFALLDAPSDEKACETLDAAFRRFLSILLGKPNASPTNEEFLMFEAHAASYQSADRSRQVGAVIVNLEGSVISIGRNDMPKVGGGVTPSSSYQREEEISRNIRSDTVEDILERLKSVLSTEFVSADKLVRKQKSMALLEGSKLFGMNEFNRMVHAEMAALTDAALRGVSVKGQMVFCTTFPCQNCAKHLMAAGLRGLYYIAPYPKSLVKDMYNDEYVELTMLTLDSEQLRKHLGADKPKFMIFTYLGVAPRRYVQLFTMPIRKLPDGSTPSWATTSAMPRIGAVGSAEYERLEREFSEPLSTFRKT